MSDMLAGRLNVQTGTFSLTRVPVPEPGRGQLRIRVAAAGVCLSDLHLIRGMLRPAFLAGPEVTLGHEVAGVVDAVGPRVARYTPGQRVLLAGGQLGPGSASVITRGVDYDGGWAEYALAEAYTVIPIPDSLSFEQACIIPDAVSTPWAAITATARVGPGESAGVWGVGGLGSHAVQLLRLAEAAPIVAVDPSAAARRRALALGADAALDPTDESFPARLSQVTGPGGLSVAFDFAGAPAAREQALRALGPRGRLVLVGLAGRPITIPGDAQFIYLRQQILGHYGSELPHYAELVDLVAGGRLDLSRSVTEVIPLAEVERALGRLADRESDVVRLVLRP
ncbi:MAG TPA: zinc-binding dehydrogenase [Nakamurella sp.]